MKRITAFLFIILTATVQIKAEAGNRARLVNFLTHKHPGTRFQFRFASKNEGQQLKMADTIYYNRLTQADIDWRMRKENATKEELMMYGREQIMDFTLEEQKAVGKAMAVIEDSLNAIGCHLPAPEEIVFIKSTMADEGHADAYTIKNQIFLGRDFLIEDSDENPQGHLRMVKTLAHELFHCISRHSPSFRREMYELIGFTVMDEEIDFPETIRARIMANPDVERYDSFGTFTINGQQRRYTLLTLYKNTWAEAYAKQGAFANFFRNIDIVLIPLDDLNVSISIMDLNTNSAPDFWTQVGMNSFYVLAPEECIADNFSFAVVPSIPREKYQTPQLIQHIIEKLRHFQ